MTTHTSTTAAVTTGPVLMASTPVFWTLIVAAVTMTIVLTGWTTAQAAVVNDIVDGNGPSFLSIRQLERQAQGDHTQHYSIRQLERGADAERQAPLHTSIRQLERATQEHSDSLEQLEAAETQRFTNRANVNGAQTHATMRPTRRELLYMEYTELRRFRNRAPASALPALDGEIERLRKELR